MTHTRGTQFWNRVQRKVDLMFPALKPGFSNAPLLFPNSNQSCTSCSPSQFLASLVVFRIMNVLCAPVLFYVLSSCSFFLHYLEVVSTQRARNKHVGRSVLGKKKKKIVSNLTTVFLAQAFSKDNVNNKS